MNVALALVGGSGHLAQSDEAGNRNFVRILQKPLFSNGLKVNVDFLNRSFRLG